MFSNKFQKHKRLKVPGPCFVNEKMELMTVIVVGYEVETKGMDWDS